MNIRDSKDFKNSFWDWTFLNIAFSPTNIRVTDVDGLVERNGFFLFIETKKPNAIIPKGQSILHDQLLRTGLFTIFIVWGNPNNPEMLRVRFGNAVKEYKGVTLDELTQHVRRWFLWVDNK